MSPLPPNVAADLARVFDQQLDTLGTTFTHTPKSGGPNTVIGSFVDPSNEDVTLLNAYGLEARVVRVDADVVVAKFETLTDPAGGRYTVQAVHDVWINDTKVGQKLYVVSA